MLQFHLFHGQAHGCQVERLVDQPRVVDDLPQVVCVVRPPDVNPDEEATGRGRAQLVQVLGGRLKEPETNIFYNSLETANTNGVTSCSKKKILS